MVYCRSAGIYPAEDIWSGQSKIEIISPNEHQKQYFYKWRITQRFGAVGRNKLRSYTDKS